MDCEEYRKAITADPGGSFEDAGHAEGCDACRAYAARIRALDERIARALALDVPDFAMPELPPAAAGERVRAVEIGERRRRWQAAPLWLAAAAAGVAAVTVLAVRIIAPGDGYYAALAGEVLAHMDHEESSRVVTTVAVSERTLADVLDRKVETLDTGAGIVSYAMSCVINGHVVPHLVVQGRTGPITVILMPEEDVDDVIPLNGEKVHGVILPAADGSIAIIGQREDQMAEVGEVGERVVDSVKWSI